MGCDGHRDTPFFTFLTCGGCTCGGISRKKKGKGDDGLEGEKKKGA